MSKIVPIFNWNVLFMVNVPLMGPSRTSYLTWPQNTQSPPFLYSPMEPYSTEPNIFTGGIYGRSSTNGMETYSGIFLRNLYLKFRYCEKATKFEKKSTFFKNYVVKSRESGFFFKIFMAFNEIKLFFCPYKVTFQICSKKCMANNAMWFTLNWS